MASKKKISGVIASQVSPSMVLPLESIVVDRDFNARKPDAEYQKGIEALANSIKKNGQDTPIIVASHKAIDPKKGKPGMYFLIAGFRRYDAIKSLGESTIIARVKDEDYESAMFTNLRENVERKSLRTYDIALRCMALKEAHDLSGADIAGKLTAGLAETDGVSFGRTYVNRLLKLLAELSPKVLKAWEAGHPLATYNFLTKNMLDCDHEEQNQKWDKVCGVVDGEDGEDGEGNGRGPSSKVQKRASAKVLAAALKAVGESSANPEYVKGVEAALMFALGKRAKIPDVYDPKAAKKAAQEAKAAQESDSDADSE